MSNFNLTDAVGKNLGIGLKGYLPFKLKFEPKYFGIATKHKKWRIPDSERPLPQRLNIVVSTTRRPYDLPQDVLLYSNLKSAVTLLDTDDKMKKQVETVWFWGDSGLYSEAMASVTCNCLYLTKRQSNFEKRKQEENNLKYDYKIMEKQ